MKFNRCIHPIDSIGLIISMNLLKETDKNTSFYFSEIEMFLFMMKKMEMLSQNQA